MYVYIYADSPLSCGGKLSVFTAAILTRGSLYRPHNRTYIRASRQILSCPNDCESYVFEVRQRFDILHAVQVFMEVIFFFCRINCDKSYDLFASPRRQVTTR